MDKKNRQSFIALLGIASIDNFGFSLIFVMFAPLFLSAEYPFFPQETSIAIRSFYLAVLFAAFPLSQFFGAPLLGDLADRIGRKKSLIISSIGVMLGFLFSGVACLFYSMWFLILSRLLTGFFAGNLGICLSGIADISPTESIRARNYGILSTAWSLSWTVAMVSGGYLSNPAKSKWLSPALPFWLTSILTLINLFILTKYYTETHKTRDAHSFNLMKGIHNVINSLKIKSIRPLFVALFFRTIGWGLCIQWYGTYCILNYGASQKLISWGLFIQGVFWAVGGSIVNPFLVRRYSSLHIGVLGFVSTALFLFVASFQNSFLTFNLFYWLASLFCAFSYSNILNATSISAPADVQGKIMGLSQSVASFGWILVPIVGGLAGLKSTHFFYPLSATFLFLTAIILFARLRTQAKEVSRSQ